MLVFIVVQVKNYRLYMYSVMQTVKYILYAEQESDEWCSAQAKTRV